MTIPEDFAQISILFAPQAALPRGALFSFGVAVTPGDTPLDVAAAVNQALFVDNEVQRCWCDDVTRTGTRVKIGPDDTGPSQEFSGNTLGLASGTSGAAAPSLLVRKNTAFGGRKDRGRMFIPGISESAIEVGGSLNGGEVSDYQVEWTGALASLATASYPMVILHDGLETPTLVTGLQVDGMVATQRRRQRR